MIKEEIKCNQCGNRFKMKNDQQLYDRAHYFAVESHYEDKPGIMSIVNIEDHKISNIRKYEVHLCNYKCLKDYFALRIKDELILEEEKEKKEASKEDK